MPMSDSHTHVKKLGRVSISLLGAGLLVGALAIFVLARDGGLAGASEPPSVATDDQERNRRDDDDRDWSNQRDRRRPDHFVSSNPDNVIWGGFPIDSPPRLTMRSGETVRIDTLSQSGATGTISPTAFFAQFGVPATEVLPDLEAFWKTIPNGGGDRQRYGPHIITGPVYIDGAEPGDTLEVQILDINMRVPYGVNNTSPMGGVLGTAYPGFRPGDVGLPTIPPSGTIPGVRQHLYRVTKVRGREVFPVSDTIHVPLAPFIGTLSVAPATGVLVDSFPTDPNVMGVQSSWPPGPFGGNMDLKDLTAGSTLFLPVFQHGAQVFMGDPHSAQGHAEVSGTAIEHSLSGVFRFVVRKGRTLGFPRAETKTHYILMGTDVDLNRAMRKATMEAVKFLVEEKGLTEARAFSLTSIAVDFHIAEVVDYQQLVAAKIPKSLFVDRSRDDDRRDDRN
jgi:acetamidase/formamidase